MQEIPPLAGAPAANQVVLPEWLEYVMWGAVIFAVLWLASTVFIQMRRRATNLTSTHQAGVKKEATPDFMTVDHKAREAAVKRGEVFEKELAEREKAEAAGKAIKKEPVGLLKQFSAIAAFLFSLFTLLGTVLGTFRTLDQAGVQLSKLDQVGVIAIKYPIPTAICAFVIVYTLYVWISQRKWTEQPKI